MKRVILSPSEFRCSVPGTPVGQATGNEISFDGFADVYNGAWIVGYVAAGAYTSSSGASGEIINTAVVSYGKTFTQAPQVLVQYEDPTQGGQAYNVSVSNSYGSTGFVTIQIGLKQFTVTYIRGGKGASSLPAQPGFSYFVTQV